LKFISVLKRNRYKQGQSDPCLFIKIEKNGKIGIMTIFVDDIVLTGDLLIIQETKEFLKSQFEMKDIGILHFILGIQVNRTRNGGIQLHQEKYIRELLKKYNMLDCKGSDIPMSRYNREDSPTMKEPTTYRELVGSLNYLANCTRPDLAYAVSHFSRYLNQPTEADWSQAKRVLRYLKDTINKKLTYGKPGEELEAYSDASYAPESSDRKSHSGYLIKMDGGALSWKSKRQPIVSLSSMEAEYIALNNTATEVLWLRKLQNDLKIETGPTRIYEDNQGAIALAKTTTFHNRSKHIQVRYHFIREKVEAKEVTLEYCPTNQMVADVLTKPLAKILHNQFVEAMGLTSQE